MKWHVWAVAFLIQSMGGFAARAEGLSLVERFDLPPTGMTAFAQPPFTAEEMTRAQGNGLKFPDRPSIGSGLARIGDHEFFGLSDRGPNGEVNGKRTFPLPRFCPYIVRCRLADGKIQITQTISLTTASGKPVSGLNNVAGEEKAYATAADETPLAPDVNGLDPEGLRVLPDGKFLISEEYGPSILVVSPEGRILVRYIPQGKTLPGADYPVQAILPAAFAQRSDNRGFEALAVSPDGQTAWAVLQSAAGVNAHPHLKNSRVSRAVRLNLKNPLKAEVTGEFLVLLSKPESYGPEQKQTSLKFNDAEWLGPGKLLLLEQGKEFARLVVADFSQATDIRSDEKFPAFESATVEDAATKIKFATTETWASTQGVKGITSTKLEGVAILSPTEIALANDNDFGLGDNLTGEPSSIWLLKLDRPLPMGR